MYFILEAINYYYYYIITITITSPQAASALPERIKRRRDRSFPCCILIIILEHTRYYIHLSKGGVGGPNVPKILALS